MYCIHIKGAVMKTNAVMYKFASFPLLLSGKDECNLLYKRLPDGHIFLA